ncbi:hypothetical protein N1851_033896 [Merluccius polli]|uniref:HAT C-terminal dimerisation domain-containing protein n=1 Tax=Merluccius polli TaxID=89951 RepID=A0AA47NN59_MERPO|nr:hypothetical protein N1851_033896 [Merluccius polli]
MVDETTDISNTAQMSYVLRYKERSFQFGDVSGDKRAEAIAGQVWEFLEDCACTNKVIVQCYDGAAVMASGLNGVQAKIKQKIPQALFIHCALSEPLLLKTECNIVFSHLSGLAAFFTKSAKRTKLLDEICQRRLPREELSELFEFIVDNHNHFDNDAVHSADGYTALLTGFEFCFLLATFNSMFAYSDVLFGILQNKEYDMQFCLSSIEDFCSTTERERDRFDSIYEDTACERAQGTESWRYARSEILDNILTQLRNSFKDHEKLMFLARLDPKYFASYRENFEARSPSDLLHFLTLKELTESMLQLYHLTCLVLTIPVSTSVERSFSALKRIKTHARNSTGQDRLGALALMSVEEGLLLELKSKDKLYDAAIAHFTKKGRRMDFVFM